MSDRRFVLDGAAPGGGVAQGAFATAAETGDLLSFDAGAAFASTAAALSGASVLRTRPWGSAHVHDPWPSGLPADCHPAVAQALQVHCEAQDPGAPHSLTWLVTDGRHTVRLEAHEAALVLHIAATSASANGDAGQPSGRGEDAVVMALRPLLPPLLTEEDLTIALRPLSAPEDAATVDAFGGAAVLRARQALQRLGALWFDDLRLLDVLRRHAAHPLQPVRASVVAVASQAGYRLFLYERAAVETDPLLRRILRTLTTPVPAESEGA